MELVIQKNPEVAKIIEAIINKKEIDPSELIRINTLLNYDSAMNFAQTLKSMPNSDLFKIMVALNKGGKIETSNENLEDALAQLRVNFSIQKNKEVSTMIVDGFDVPENVSFEEPEISNKFAQQSEDIEEDDKALEEFMVQKDPQTPEEKDKAIEEFFENRYYLTGTRIFESLQQTDSFKTLDANTQNKIRDAYLKCVHPTDLLDPNYLNDKIDLGVSGPVKGFESIHMIALGGTFVGYKMEKAQDLASPEPTNSIDEGSLAEQVSGISTMGTASKDETILEAKKIIEERIKEIFSGGNILENIDSMLPIEALIGGAIAEYSKNTSDTKKGTSAKMYAKELEEDFVGHSENQMENLYVRIDLSSVDWSDDEQRRKILERFSKLNEEANDFQIENPFNTIHINYTIKDASDLDKLFNIERDLSQVTSNLEIDVTIDEQDPERLIEFQNTLASRGSQGIGRTIMNRISERINERLMGQVVSMATRVIAPQFAAMPGSAFLMNMAGNAIAETMGIQRGGHLSPVEQINRMARGGATPLDLVYDIFLNPDKEQEDELGHNHNPFSGN